MLGLLFQPFCPRPADPSPHKGEPKKQGKGKPTILIGECAGEGGWTIGQNETEGFSICSIDLLSSPCALMTRTCQWVTILESEDAGVKGVVQKGIPEC